MEAQEYLIAAYRTERTLAAADAQFGRPRPKVNPGKKPQPRRRSPIDD